MSQVECFFALPEDKGVLPLNAAIQIWTGYLQPGGHEHSECRRCGTCRKAHARQMVQAHAYASTGQGFMTPAIRGTLLDVLR